MTRFRAAALLFAATFYSLVTFIVLAVGQSEAGEQSIEFEDCFLENISREVKCFDLQVLENWDDPEGGKINIHGIIIPAQGAEPSPDPFILFAGGPGQAATDYAALIPSAFNRINQKRDIILIDQRGTGDSTALKCEFPARTVARVSDQEILEDLRQCLATFEADIRYFTSFDIIRDLEHIRGRLGINQWNIWGGSYGTRLGLLYIKLHPTSIRTAVLDGVTAPNSRLFVLAPKAAEDAWQKLVTDCLADEGCKATYPDLDKNFRNLLKARGENPETVKVRDQWSGEWVDVLIDRDWLAETVRSGLYLPSRAAIIPFGLEKARAGDYAPLIALSLDSSFWGAQTMAIGSTLAILCSEELLRNPEDDVARAGQGSFHGDYYYRFWALACQQVPTRDVLAGYEEPVSADIPTLILSGGLDPVTPPFQGDIAAESLPNSWHLVADNAGHNVTPEGCAPRILAEFVDKASLEGVDVGCISDTVRPPFLLTPLTYALSHDSPGEDQ